MKIISIEGNIGSGKSTFLEELKKSINDERICFLEEPVDIWNTIMDLDGITMLQNYYKDTKKYAFSFQMMAYISRLSLLKQAIESKQYDIIITERSLYTDKYVFCKMLYDNNLIEHLEYSVYNKWFDAFNIIEHIQYVYLKTDPDVSYSRVLKRSRLGEEIPLKYLETCSQYHDEWLSTQNVCMIDANLENTPETINRWVQSIIEIL
jgi:deoxyadenosine/deoxycytidine kinase